MDRGWETLAARLARAWSESRPDGRLRQTEVSQRSERQGERVAEAQWEELEQGEKAQLSLEAGMRPVQMRVEPGEEELKKENLNSPG